MHLMIRFNDAINRRRFRSRTSSMKASKIHIIMYKTMQLSLVKRLMVYKFKQLSWVMTN